MKPGPFSAPCRRMVYADSRMARLLLLAIALSWGIGCASVPEALYDTSRAVAPPHPVYGTPALSLLPEQQEFAQTPQRVEVRAPIVRVSVRVAESFPPQYFADVTSGLPDGCTEFGRYAVRREASTLFVDVFNTRPAGSDVVCTMIYGEKETAVPLGTGFTPGSTYTLDVNGSRETFVVQ